MHVTIKGQVTIPRDVREDLEIGPHSDVEFVRQKDGSYRLVNKRSVKTPEPIFGLAGSGDGENDHE